MKRLIALCIALLGALTLNAQNGKDTTDSIYPALPYAQKMGEVIDLWPNGAPDSNGQSGPVVNVGGAHLENISIPRMIVFKPAKPNGICIIMCPGGGYKYESIYNEGAGFSLWMNAIGVTYCLLEYRLPNYGHSEVALHDAEQAVRYMRAHAAEYELKKVGIMGGSAGGHLASTLATHFDSAESRPDFQILLYPVITMDAAATHKGSRDYLLGLNPTPEQVALYSNELQVTKNTPKAFIALSTNDKTVPPVNSLNYYKALLDNGVSAEMHIYPTGGHGWGSRDNFTYKLNFQEELSRWINELK
jgi:acetyl esterase/lipase